MSLLDGYVSLTVFDLAAAGLLLVINGLVSIAFRLGLEKQLAIAALRTVVQLAAAGLVLKLVIEQSSPWWTLAVALAMLLFATHEVVARQGRRIAGWGTHALGLAILFLVGTTATLYGVGYVIRPDPWSSPRYLLPILGMILGNALTGVALVLDQLTEGARIEQRAVEARLAMGASRFAALEGVLRRALRTAMMPLINGMAVAGVVSLPGMMTGQILAGVEPVEAAKYQILVMFLLAGATALAVLMAALGGMLLLTDRRDRLRLDRLVPG